MTYADDGLDRLDIDPFIKNIIRQSHADAKDNAPAEQYRLGTLIEKLDAIEDKTLDVHFDFAHFRPTRIHSWRGIFSQLAIGYDPGAKWHESMTVAQLLDLLRAADGAIFEGYKGGDFLMDLETPLWVAEPDESGSTGIRDVTLESYYVVLHTAHFEH